MAHKLEMAYHRTRELYKKKFISIKAKVKELLHGYQTRSLACDRMSHLKGQGSGWKVSFERKKNSGSHKREQCMQEASQQRTICHSSKTNGCLTQKKTCFSRTYNTNEARQVDQQDLYIPPPKENQMGLVLWNWKRCSINWG